MKAKADVCNDVWCKWVCASTSSLCFWAFQPYVNLTSLFKWQYRKVKVLWHFPAVSRLNVAIVWNWFNSEEQKQVTEYWLALDQSDKCYISDWFQHLHFDMKTTAEKKAQSFSCSLVCIVISVISLCGHDYFWWSWWHFSVRYCRRQNRLHATSRWRPPLPRIHGSPSW